MIFDEDTLAKYNKAINKYRERVERNNMGGLMTVEELENKYAAKLPCGCPKPWRIPKHPQCVLNKPLYMVIPPEGIHLSCPAHSEGHHVFGSQVSY
jgi:hypothetical protein